MGVIMQLKGKNQIKEAIKKLKSQVYYDKSNTNLHLRKQLVTYLHRYGKQKLEDSVYNLLTEQKNFETLLENISFVVIPKRIKMDNHDEQFITNFKGEKKTTVEDINLTLLLSFRFTLVQYIFRTSLETCQVSESPSYLSIHKFES